MVISATVADSLMPAHQILTHPCYSQFSKALCCSVSSDKGGDVNVEVRLRREGIKTMSCCCCHSKNALNLFLNRIQQLEYICHETEGTKCNWKAGNGLRESLEQAQRM